LLLLFFTFYAHHYNISSSSLTLNSPLSHLRPWMLNSRLTPESPRNAVRVSAPDRSTKIIIPLLQTFTMAFRLLYVLCTVYMVHPKRESKGVYASTRSLREPYSHLLLRNFLPWQVYTHNIDGFIRTLYRYTTECFTNRFTGLSWKYYNITYINPPWCFSLFVYYDYIYFNLQQRVGIFFPDQTLTVDLVYSTFIINK